MGHKYKQIMRNFSYTFTSNILATLISMIVTLIVPKLIGVESYGYFQLYMLYITFLGIFHFGLVDGIYLRIGGKRYSELNSNDFSNEFLIFEILEVTVSILGIIVTLLFVPDADKAFVLVSSAICLVIYNSDIFIQFILLATSQMKRYSLFIIADRLTYFILLVVLLFMGITSYKQLIFIDLLARFLILLIAIKKNKNLLLNFKFPLTGVIRLIKIDINSGYKVTLGGIAGIFITGIVRFFIENRWGIRVFGQVSLSFTLSNLLMVFVNAISLVIFPVLKTTSNTQLPKMYIQLRTVLMVVLLGCLVFYAPVASLIGLWLPKYADSLNYLALMFPMVIFNSKTAMLITTYLKSLRLEKYILITNLVSVGVSALLAYIAVFILNNQILSIIVIVVGIAVRSIYSEVIVSKRLKISVISDIFLEVALSTIFMYVSWNLSPVFSTVIYLFVYLIYLFLKRDDILNLVGVIRQHA